MNVVLTKPSGDILWTLTKSSKTSGDIIFRTSVFDPFALGRDAIRFRNGMAAILFKTRETFESRVKLKSGRAALVKAVWVEQMYAFVVVFCDCGHSEMLTDKQAEIVALMKQDNTITEISNVLGITESTVQSHLANLRAKIGVKTNYGLISAL